MMRQSCLLPASRLDEEDGEFGQELFDQFGVRPIIEGHALRQSRDEFSDGIGYGHPVIVRQRDDS